MRFLSFLLFLCVGVPLFVRGEMPSPQEIFPVEDEWDAEGIKSPHKKEKHSKKRRFEDSEVQYKQLRVGEQERRAHKKHTGVGTHELFRMVFEENFSHWENHLREEIKSYQEYISASFDMDKEEFKREFDKEGKRLIARFQKRLENKDLVESSDQDTFVFCLFLIEANPKFQKDAIILLKKSLSKAHVIPKKLFYRMTYLLSQLLVKEKRYDELLSFLKVIPFEKDINGFGEAVDEYVRLQILYGDVSYLMSEFEDAEKHYFIADQVLHNRTALNFKNFSDLDVSLLLRQFILSYTNLEYEKSLGLIFNYFTTYRQDTFPFQTKELFLKSLSRLGAYALYESKNLSAMKKFVQAALPHTQLEEIVLESLNLFKTMDNQLFLAEAFVVLGPLLKDKRTFLSFAELKLSLEGNEALYYQQAYHSLKVVSAGSYWQKKVAPEREEERQEFVKKYAEKTARFFLSRGSLDDRKRALETYYLFFKEPFLFTSSTFFSASLVAYSMKRFSDARELSTKAVKIAKSRDDIRKYLDFLVTISRKEVDQSLAGIVLHHHKSSDILRMGEETRQKSSDVKIGERERREALKAQLAAGGNIALEQKNTSQNPPLLKEEEKNKEIKDDILALSYPEEGTAAQEANQELQKEEKVQTVGQEAPYEVLDHAITEQVSRYLYDVDTFVTQFPQEFPSWQHLFNSAMIAYRVGRLGESQVRFEKLLNFQQKYDYLSGFEQKRLVIELVLKAYAHLSTVREGHEIKESVLSSLGALEDRVRNDSSLNDEIKKKVFREHYFIVQAYLDLLARENKKVELAFYAREWAKIYSKNPDAYQVLLRSTIEFSALNKWKEVLPNFKAFQIAFSKTPDFPEMQYWYGMALVEEFEFEKAADILFKAAGGLDLLKKRTALRRAGGFFESLKEFDKAGLAYHQLSQVMEEKEKKIFYQFKSARFYMKAENFDRALVVYNEVMAKEKGNTFFYTARFGSLFCLDKLGKLTGGIDSLLETLKNKEIAGQEVKALLSHAVSFQLEKQMRSLDQLAEDKKGSRVQKYLKQVNEIARTYEMYKKFLEPEKLSDVFFKLSEKLVKQSAVFHQGAALSELNTLSQFDAKVRFFSYLAKENLDEDGPDFIKKIKFLKRYFKLPLTDLFDDNDLLEGDVNFKEFVYQEEEFK